MYSIKYSQRANADLEDITDYTASTWGAEQAKRYIHEIRQKIQEISEGNAVTQSLDGVSRKISKARANRHLIIFEKKEEVIFVVRILHETMDIPRHIHYGS